MTFAQNDAMAKLMTNSYDSLQAAGVITTPSAQSVSAVVGQVYTGTNAALTNATTAITNTVNGQVASLVTNASQYGTQLTAQWAKDLPGVTNLTSNLTSITGMSIPGIPNIGSLTSGITPDFAGVKTAMDSLGKASQFAASATSTLTGGLDKLSNLSVSDLTSKLPSASDLAGKVSGQATALAGQLAGQVTDQAKALIANAEGQAKALIASAQGQFNSLLQQGDSLVASVQKAAGFANTVNRATVDVAFTKILGSAKIPTPSFGAPDSASIAAALDISKAQSIISDLQGQATGLVNQAQGQANNLLASAKTAVNQIV